jgi:hypothetical protein
MHVNIKELKTGKYFYFGNYFLEYSAAWSSQRRRAALWSTVIAHVGVTRLVSLCINKNLI